MRAGRISMTVLAVALCFSSWFSRAAVTPPDEPMFPFKYYQVELPKLIQAVGDMTGRRFVMDESVKGNVTVHSPDLISAADVYPLLLSILEMSGYSVMEKGGAIHVIPLPEGEGAIGRVLAEGEAATDGLNTRIFRLSHISANEVARLLEPLIRGGKTGAVAAFPSTNYLLVTGTGDAINKIEQLIRDLDVPGATRTMQVIQLKHASADAITAQLIRAMSGAETPAELVGRHIQKVGVGAGDLPASLVIVAVPNANSIVVVGTPMQLTQVMDIVGKIDIPTPVEFGRLNAIRLKYISSEEAATTLNNLLAKTAAKDQAARISIEHNNANNALVVESSPQDFELVRKLVDELDRMPPQVMVEVVIAEVSMGQDLELGVEWNTIDAPVEGSTRAAGRSRPGESDSLANIIETGAFPQGLSLGVTRGTYVDASGSVLPRIPFLIQALAKDRDVKILSNIPLWAQNNTEAMVSVVENIPILKSKTEGTGDNRYVTQEIAREDVGIMLKLTPHINADNEVKLKLKPSIQAVTDTGPAETEFAPTISKREVETTITIPDRSTVVISGLIREDQIKVVSKVPLLGDLPLLGWLFRSTADRVQRTNLLIFVTPNIIKEIADADSVRASLESRSSISVTSALPVAVEAELAP